MSRSKRSRVSAGPVAGAGRHGARCCSSRSTAWPAAVEEEAARVRERAAATAGATEILRAPDEAERHELWRVRRELSLSLKMVAARSSTTTSSCRRAASRSCSRWSRTHRADYRLRIPCFGHAGDGNIHVNIMVDPDDADEIRARARGRAACCSSGVVALEGSISGEHGIGFAKAPFIGLELSDRRDRADEARQAGVRPAQPAQSRKDVSAS